MWAREDAEVEVRYKLEGGYISKEQEDELKECLSSWSEVLTDKPGKTAVQSHDVIAGDALPGLYYIRCQLNG